MSAGTHDTANVARPKRRMMWVFGGAATAVVAGGLLMQYFRAPTGEAAQDGPAGTARVGAPQKSPPVARVGNEYITKEAVAEECFNRYGREVLDDLIHRLIITKACEQAGVTVSEQEVSQEIARIAERFKLDVTAYLQMLQSERNITPMQYRTSVIWPMLALKKLAGESVDISEEDMQKSFVRNYGPRVKARVIMVDSLAKGNEVWEKAKQDPDNFDKLAQQYSVDPNSRALGGQVPPIPRYTGNDNLEQEAFKLKEGEISGLIEIATRRWVILKCEGRTTPIVTDIEEVRDTLYDELKEAKTQQAVGKVFEELKKTTRVDNLLTNESHGPDRALPVGAQGINPRGAVQQANGTRTPATRAPAAPATSAAPARTPR